MPVFKDSSGTEWQVLIDAPIIKEVRKELDFDLVANDACVKLSKDELTLVDVLYVVCREQAAAKNISDVQFGRLLVGDHIEHATTAIIQAITDFFPPRKRSLLRSLSDSQAAVMDKGTELAVAKITNPELREQILAKVGTDIDDLIRKLLTSPSGVTSLPDSLESAPTD